MTLSFRKVLAKLLCSGYVYSSVVQLLEFIKNRSGCFMYLRISEPPVPVL